MKTAEKLPVRNIRERDPLTDQEKVQAAKVLSATLYYSIGGRSLELDKARAMGAKDSAHDVFFVKTPQRDDAGKRAIYACKRFRRLESAKHEIAAIQEAKTRGFTTLKPVEDGIFSVKDVGHIVVTKHEPRFTTMNYLGWRDSYAGQADYERRIAQPLRGMATFAAQMHSQGIAHGDFQPKNLGRNYIGEFVLFDTEDTVFASPDEINDIDFVSRAGDDLSVLMVSLVSRGYLWNSTDDTFTQEIQNNLLDPYMATIVEQGTIENSMLITYADQALREALTQRPLLHNDFSSRIGLPS